MSRIDELIHELAPTGVPHIRLGELGEFIRGRRFTKDDRVENGLGAIHYGEIYTHYGTAATATRSFVRPELKSSLRFARTGDLIIAATGENAKDVCKAVAWLGDGEVAVHDDCYIYRHQLDPRFASYYFQSAAFQDQKIKLTSESKLARVSGTSLAKIIAPVPPREVQREVVTILDRFSALEAQLEAELQAEREERRRQYAHYRDSLLTFREAGRVRWVPMGEVLDMRAGRFIAAGEISPIQDHAHPFVCFGGNGVRGFVAQPSHEGPLALIGRQGALCGNVKRVRGKFYATEHAVVVTPHSDVNIDWVFYMLEFMDLNQYATKSAQPGLAVRTLEDVALPIPPLEEQGRIVAILDKLDALVNDLSIGLPAELAARRKQYEYYRDRLLTFDEAVA